MFVKKIALAALLAVTPALAFAGTTAAPAAPAAKTEQAKPATKAPKAVKKASTKAPKAEKKMEGGEMKASQGRSVKTKNTTKKLSKTSRVNKAPAVTPAVAK